MILSLNGALPVYNTVHAYVLHELSKAQSTMLLTYCAPALVMYCRQAGLYHVYAWAAKMSKKLFWLQAKINFTNMRPGAEVWSLSRSAC